MWFYMLSLYLQAPKSVQRARLVYLIVSLILTCLSCGSTIIGCISLFEILSRLVPNAVDFDKVWDVYNEVYFGLWLRGSLLWNIFVWLSDALLIYRCYAVWYDRAWVALIPLLVFLANLGVGIPSFTFSLTEPTTVYHQLNVADIVLSVVLNILITGLISGRLIHAHRRLSRVIPLAKHKSYLNTIAILVESAAPLAVFGLGVAVVRLMEDKISVLRADTIFFIGYRVAATLSPQLIIFRVALGNSWAGREDSQGMLSGINLELQLDDSVETRSHTPSHRSISIGSV
ncbi:hypothetical protein BKA70DRAFT_1568066 [Coprinopsis sp. MPI-PUGE-AT-0042]|nr:hypothetical protein BKA70DRAFT_1568066 [Coprinopsis sp. MPI-PUGE-AT-0042]